jgi:phosphoribosylanthranilate isomerase
VVLADTPLRTRVKICCIASRAEAELAVSLGADVLGLVGAMPSGPGVIDDDLARAIALATPPPVATFLLTSRERGDDLVDHVERCAPTAVQIVRHVAIEAHEILAKRVPHVRRVQVLHVEDERALDLVDTYAPHVHAFLLDSGRPSAAVPELGGTGRVHDWNISADLVRRSPVPVFLAGGLTPDNVARAIATVRPYGLDICSGVRTHGALDGSKLRAFMTRVAETVA